MALDSDFLVDEREQRSCPPIVIFFIWLDYNQIFIDRLGIWRRNVRLNYAVWGLVYVNDACILMCLSRRCSDQNIYTADTVVVDAAVVDVSCQSAIVIVTHVVDTAASTAVIPVCCSSSV